MASVWLLVGFFALVVLLRALPFRGGRWVLLAGSLLLVAFATYWLASLHLDVPGAASLRSDYAGTARQVGVGVEYRWGPLGMAALYVFGLFGVGVVLSPARKD